MQTINSAGKLRGNEPATSGANSNEMLQLTKIIIQKQSELNNYINIGSRQQMLYNKMSKLKRALVDSDSNIKTLLVYLKEAEQILSSAVYQSKIKLNMIKKAKALPADLLIRYAHKISSDYGVCCPENWVPDNPKRPYPTDADMRRGWLMQVSNIAGDLSKTEPADSVKPNLLRSTSKMIEPIVPHNFDFNDKDSKYMSASNNNNNSTEYMSDMSSDSSSDSEKI